MPQKNKTTATRLSCECRICKTGNNTALYKIREMMFGLDEKFDYFQCAGCGCLQIAAFPRHMEKYYPPDYYSLSGSDKDQSSLNLPEWILGMLGGDVVRFSEIIARNPPQTEKEKKITANVMKYYFKNFNISFDSNILDVGSGSGSFLKSLLQSGYKNILGVDPYINQDIFIEDRLLVKAGTIFDMPQEKSRDIIMFNDSLEHMADPVKVIRAASELLSEDGICIIRTPVIPCFAWEHYGTQWVSLDAPRHFYIFSEASINHLAKRCNLELIDQLYDSISFQFWGSEQYQKEVPLYSEKSFAVHPFKSDFSIRKIIEFEKRAVKANREKQGDHAAFYLRKRKVSGV